MKTAIVRWYVRMIRLWSMKVPSDLQIYLLVSYMMPEKNWKDGMILGEISTNGNVAL